VIILHHWAAKDLKLYAPLQRKLAQRGIASAILELPLHLSRAPKGSQSGELFFSTKPLLTVLCMEQAQRDTATLRDELCRRFTLSPGNVSILGVSLGAIIGAKAFLGDRAYAKFISFLGGGDLADLFQTCFPLSWWREKLQKMGISVEMVANAAQPYEPLRHSPDSRPAWLVRTRLDMFVPVRNAALLASRFSNAQLTELPCGHIGAVFSIPKLSDDAVDFLAGEFSLMPRRVNTAVYRIALAQTGFFPKPLLTRQIAATPDGRLHFDFGLHLLQPVADLGYDLGKTLRAGILQSPGRKPQPYLALQFPW